MSPAQRVVLYIVSSQTHVHEQNYFLRSQEVNSPSGGPKWPFSGSTFAFVTEQHHTMIMDKLPCFVVVSQIMEPQPCPCCRSNQPRTIQTINLLVFYVTELNPGSRRAGRRRACLNTEDANKISQLSFLLRSGARHVAVVGVKGHPAQQTCDYSVEGVELCPLSIICFPVPVGAGLGNR